MNKRIAEQEKQQKSNRFSWFPLWMTIGLTMLFSACSVTKHVPDGSFLLQDVRVESEDKNVDAGELKTIVRQRENSKWFSLVKIPLLTYSLSGRDTTRWVNRLIQKMGQPPVCYDTVLAKKSCNDLVVALKNKGYLGAKVRLEPQYKGKKVVARYILTPGKRSQIGHIKYDIQDSVIANLLRTHVGELSLLREGEPLSVEKLDDVRKDITKLLMNNGYYRFHKDYIYYEADSTNVEQGVDLVLHLLPYHFADDEATQLHPRYYIRQINFQGDDSAQVGLRKKVLLNNTAIVQGKPYCAADLQKTYNNFAKLQAVKYTNIRFREVPGTNFLDCDIAISLNKPSTISFQPEGTNTAGDLGAAASVTYQNRNLFKGSEVLSLQARAAFEAITDLEGYQNQDYKEYNIEGKLLFPRFLVPFVNRETLRRSNATSEMSLSWNLQNRPEFHRRVFSTAWRYRWNNPKRTITYRYDLFDLNYVIMPWISSTFKRDYLDNVNSRNAILRYNYEDLFIMKMGLGMTYNDKGVVLRANVESAGNFLNLATKTLSMQKNAAGKYTLFNIAYAQYVKADIDYAKVVRFDSNNAVALHLGFGIAYPYGNSTILPFEKRYFSGGANSVRGWSVRSLGPGKFRGTDGRIDFINQTGDLKLDLSVEYRTLLFWKIQGALFVDAGNIWTLRSYEEQPGGQFHIKDFYKEIAVAYGLGFRLNLNYFILRLDAGMKAVNPAYESIKEHYPLLAPKLKRDLAIHFAVGLPF